MENKKGEISLEEHRKIMLNILKEFASFCNKHNLRYFLDAGTLLGAVRHQGFIPWDNDADVAMPREDYDKFLKIMAERGDKINDYIVLERPEDTIYKFLKIGDNRTSLIEFENKAPIDCYCYIDVFPKDGIYELNNYTKRLCKKTERLGVLHWFNKYSIDYWTKRKKGIKKIIAKIAKVFIKDRNWAYKKQCKVIKKHNKKHPYNECKYVTTLVNGEYHKCALKEYFDDFCLLNFEGETFKAPIGYDGYLKVLYPGDYMQLPPEDKRMVHEVKVSWRNN